MKSNNIYKTITKLVVVSFFIYFISWFVVYKTGLNSLAIQSEDALTASFLPFSIIKERSLYLDTYYSMILERYPHPDDKSYEKGLIPYYMRGIADNNYSCPENITNDIYCTHKFHYVSAFPIITPILAIPIYLIPVLLNITITWDLVYFLSHFASAFIVAISGGLMFLLLYKHFDLTEKKAMLLTFVYLFATVNFSMMSQSLWQQGTLQLFIILSLVFLYERRFFWYSFVFCLAVLSRPTAIFMSPILAIYTLVYVRNNNFKLKKTIVHAILGALIPILFFFWYNNTFYQNISNQGYYDQLTSEWLSKFPEGFLGIWISPSKGILIYSPVFIFSLVGMFINLKKRFWRVDPKYIFFGVIILVHTLIMGKWKHWYGGYSYGYRMASDIIPFLILLIVPYVNSEIFRRTKKVFFISIVLSVLIQFGGVVFFDGIWHAAYDKGFKDTLWLWSIKDSEFMFNIRRILVKLGILERACPRCLPA